MTARQRLMAKLGVDAAHRFSPQRLLALANRRLAATKKKEKEELQALINAYRQETDSRKKRKAPEVAEPEPPEAEEPKDDNVLGRLLAEYEREKKARRDLEKLSDEKLVSIFTEIAKLVARA